MEQHGFVEYAKPYNSIIFALGSRKDYAEKAIEFWNRMQFANVVPDEHTFVGVLKACAHLGDVGTAYDVI